MGSFSDFLEKKILDHILGGTVYTPPSDLYIGLSSSSVNDESTGSSVSEPASNTGYARVKVTNNTTTWSDATGTTATKKNKIDIEFPEATTSWGVISYFFIADAATGGNILMWGSLSQSKTIDIGDLPRFNANFIEVTLD